MSKMILNKKTSFILEEFTTGNKKRIYGRDIAKKLKMNQKTVSNILNKLEKENILKFSIEGKNKYYFLNKFNTNVREIIKLVEINKKINFLEKYKKIKNLFNRIEEKSRGIVVVFGSYAKRIANERSDIDLFIIGKIDEVSDLESLYNKKINVIKTNKSKVNKKEHIMEEIIKNHIILKGVEEFMELIW